MTNLVPRLRPLIVLSFLAMVGGGCSASAVDDQSRGQTTSASTDRSSLSTAVDPSFQNWVDELRNQAIREGVSPNTFDQAFERVRPLDRVIELDRSQPEFTLSFWRYMSNAVNDRRIEEGRDLLQQHRPLLSEVEQRYGVQPRFLVAFWGLETNYGATFGNFPVISSLATLAYDERRSAFFREELLHALKILDSGDISPERMEGSWAGAMGHLQFMPSTYTAYATDADGDSRRDIWGSMPDVFASAANFLSSIGWRGDQTWGQEVRLPANFDWSLVSIETMPETLKTIDEWKALGLHGADGATLPSDNREAAVILPAGSEGPAFLVYHNYTRILQWNRSILYAVAVGYLADKLVGGPDLTVSAPQEDVRLSVDQVKDMQSRLGRLGFNAGPADGKVGPMTRTAIRDYQESRGLPADAFPSRKLLRQIRSEE
ncbi:lytic murein transglycosylase [Fodinicurvata fenggangensis]|uniref:lytic murein transglycosylase n=1 Tax=Fodinicurvata fenggangensis TaxID=1121830 RepID=UPI0009DE20FB|nr:lytic murein transglycosylase [Fodinicurvata fenggangensis]